MHGIGRRGCAVILGALLAGCLEVPPAGSGGGRDAGASDAAGGDGRAPVEFGAARGIAGYRHGFCAVGESGLVACWGDVDFEHVRGLSGAGSPQPRLVMLDDVAPLTGAVAVEVGETHACAVLEEGGRVACWGLNETGQLGRGFSDGDGPHPAQVVDDLDSVTALAVGGAHGCALSGETLFCWGRDAGGELGNGAGGENVPSPSAVHVGVRAVGAGHRFTCIAHGDGGALWCTGSAEGEEAGEDPLHEFTPLSGADGFVGVDGSAQHGCARAEDGSISCWGSNVSGQLGNGLSSEDPTTVPAQVLMPEDCMAMDVDVGGATSCAVCEDRRTYCWGAGGGGRLGIGSSPGVQPEPAAVADGAAGVLRATRVAQGVLGGCAIDEVGQVRCWGANEFGRLGVGMSADELPFVDSPAQPVDFGDL